MKKFGVLHKNGTIVARNKAVSFHYEIIEILEAGIVLSGSEVKSLRLYSPNIAEAYAVFIENELFVKNIDMPQVDFIRFNKHETRGARKLLLRRNELNKLLGKLTKGFTIVPTEIFFDSRGFVKVKIAIVKGKKLFDKRRSEKEKDLKMEMKRAKLDL